jgi:hypothetical protein
MPDDFMQKLEKLDNIENYAPELLKTASDIVKDKLKSKLVEHEESGDLYKSIKASTPKENDYGWYTKVYASGKDHKGMSNNMKLVWLNYGTYGHTGNPVVQQTRIETEKAVINALQTKIEEVAE